MADANTTVFTAKVNGDKTKVILTEVTDKIVPAGNAVILKSTATPIIMTIVSASGTLDNNDLQGSSDDIATPPNTYMLSKNASNVVGFYQWSGTNIPAGKAYLTLPSSARSFLGFGDGQTTTINAVKKVIADEPIYNLTGRKVGGNPQRGIYIRNGKKFIIK